MKNLVKNSKNYIDWYEFGIHTEAENRLSFIFIEGEFNKLFQRYHHKMNIQFYDKIYISIFGARKSIASYFDDINFEILQKNL